MFSRREALRQLAAGAAWAAMPGVAASRVLGANDRIRFGLIGAGSRGKEIFKVALRCPNVEAVAVADLYTRRLDEAKAVAPAVKTLRRFPPPARRQVDRRGPDRHAAAPARPELRARDPGRQGCLPREDDGLQSRPRPAHAQGVYRLGTRGPGRHADEQRAGHAQGPGVAHARAAWARSPPSRRTIIATAPYGGWLRQIPPDCDAEHVDWPAFEGEAPHHAFDPQRYMNWRFYWDYSGGNVFENMVHQVAFWYEVLGLNIPQSVTMAGANFRSPKMEVPDTMSVSMNQSENLLFTWNSMFGNAYYGERHDYLFGTKGTVMHDESDQAVYLPPEREKNVRGMGRVGGELLGFDGRCTCRTSSTACAAAKSPTARSRWDSARPIACQMAIASYRRQRAVRWDPQAEDIV